MLDRHHLVHGVVEPVIGVGRAILCGSPIGDGVPVSVCQPGNMGIDGLFPTRETSLPPAPGIVWQEAVGALRAFGIGNGGRPTGIHIVGPSGRGKCMTLTGKRGTSQIGVDAGRPFFDECVLTDAPVHIGKSGKHRSGGIGLLGSLRGLGSGDALGLFAAGSLFSGDTLGLFLGLDSLNTLGNIALSRAGEHCALMREGIVCIERHA